MTTNHALHEPVRTMSDNRFQDATAHPAMGHNTRKSDASSKPIDMSAVEKTHTADTTAAVSRREGEVQADPFGDETGAQVHYKTMKWWHAGLLLVAETVSLGILGLPATMASVGLVPGTLLIVGLGIIATYTGYVIFQLKMRYPEVHNYADAGELLFGRVGREVMMVCQTLIFVLIMAAHTLTFSVMMNVLTGHATCTVVFTIMGAVLSFVLSLPRTMKNIAYQSVGSCLSVLTAVIVAMVAIGVRKPGMDLVFAVTPSNLSSFQAGAVGISNIIIAYAGHVAFFGIISELKEAREFPKSLALLQAIAITLYTTVAVVVYSYAGNNVASPALTSAGPLSRKIAYGIATPTIIIAGVVNAHVCVKNIYVRIWRNTNVMSEKSVRSIGSWAAICALTWFAAWVIASAIPVFSQLLGLVGALFCTWFSMGLCAIFWLWMNKGQYLKNWKKMTMTGVNVFILVLAITACAIGTYGTAKTISENKGDRRPFSCASNAP